MAVRAFRFLALAAVPIVFASQPARAQCETLVYSEDFEGNGGALPPGWSASGLWHMSQACKQSWETCLSGSWVYYGNEAGCHYNFPTLKGTLSSPVIPLPPVPPGDSLVLDYCEAEATDCEGMTFNLVVVGNGTTVIPIECWGVSPPYSLTGLAGNSVALRWEFEAESSFNNGTGIRIDNLSIKLYTGSGGDCNQNLVPDDCDIQLGNSEDCDANAVPDECQGSSDIYCWAEPNTAGPGAKIGFKGSRIVPCNNLVLGVTQAPPNQLGIFFYGPQTAPGIPFGEGVRCVGGQTHRLLPVVFLSSTGAGTYEIDYPALPPAGQINPGSTWYFQFWYRDPVAVGWGFNLSDALKVTFSP